MKFTVLTLFPGVIDSYVNSSIVKRAQEKGLVEIEVINIRRTPYQQVDDYAYGGSSGIVLKIEPIVEILRDYSLLDKHIVLLSPSGVTLNQELSRELSVSHKHIVLVCGHYEGIDARIENYVSQEISIGDYIVTSGELASLVLLDSITRLIPGVINKVSLNKESFDDYLLDFPVYTKPQVFEGHSVPSVYLSGDHSAIQEFRDKEREEITKRKRPDLWKKHLESRGL